MSSTYNIHRTRQNFKNNGIDDFRNMSMKGIEIVDNVVKKTGGIVDQTNNKWIIKN
jgi:hypothetical protein